MKHTISLDDLELLNKGLAAADIQLSARKNRNCPVELNCSFINNTDGTLRWLWPSSSSSASFLRFYHAEKKHKLAVLFVRLCIMLGLGRLVISGKCKLYTNGSAERTMSELYDWALFTGIVGENRKLTVWYKNNRGSWLAKFPLTRLAAINMSNEVYALNEPSTAGINKPSFKMINDLILIHSDIYQHNFNLTPHAISELPVKPLQRWLMENLQETALYTADWWQAIKNKQKRLSITNRNISNILPERLSKLTNSFTDDDIVLTANAHGDFTPWNMRFNAEEIFLLNWDFYSENKPVLFDLFHFIYQDSVLSKQLSFSAIRKQIDSYLSQPEWQFYIKANDIDVAKAEQLYLIYTIAQGLNTYNKQENWHRQVRPLLDVWSEALGFWLNCKTQKPARYMLVEDMINHLLNIPYAVLETEKSSIAQLSTSSTIKICIGKKNAASLATWLQHHNQVAVAKCIKLSFINRITMILQDNTTIHIDLIWEMKRKNIVYMNSNEVLRLAIPNENNIKIPQIIHEVRYTWLSYLFTKAPLPQKYTQIFTLGAIYHEACDMLISKYSLNTSRLDLFKFDSSRYKKVLHKIRLQKENMDWRYIKHTVAYFIDTIKLLRSEGVTLPTYNVVSRSGKKITAKGIRQTIENSINIPAQNILSEA